VETSYDADKNVLYLQLSDGRRLFVPKEELSKLKNATSEQASGIVIVLQGSSLWWPQIDDAFTSMTFSNNVDISPASSLLENYPKPPEQQKARELAGFPYTSNST